MVKCIAVKCDSGYKNKRSSEEQTRRFFYVPKDKNLIKKWQRAILRDDIEVKEGQAVCDKHFAESDIIRERTIIGPDGIVLGTVCIFRIYFLCCILFCLLCTSNSQSRRIR